MRPRLITAENCTSRPPCAARTSCFNEAAAHHRGEQERALAGATWPVDASMRPRLITAENGGSGQRRDDDGHASMRPRLITAENL